MTESQTIDIVQAVVKYQNMIHSYAYAITRDFHLAQDVYQDVAVIVAKAWETAPRDEGFLPWLRETVRRKSLENLRRQKRMPATFSDEALEALAEKFAGDAGSGGAVAGDDPTAALMQRCLGKLNSFSRKVIEARYGDEPPRTCEEIAAALGRSVQAIYSIIKRARLVLTRCVEQGKAGRPFGAET